jgi:rod shape-determining protein MreB and related proteins
MAGADIGIDLGTANVIIYIDKKGIVLNEPSVVAIDKFTKNVLAVGLEARKMIGRTPDNILAIRPIKEGVISDFSITEKMIKYFINKATQNTIFFKRKPRVSVCVPSSVTEVEKRAVEDATRRAGAREVYVIEEPLAAAIGSGIDISRACGSMIVDIGGGTTDVAVISLGSSVVSTSIKIAGDNFDDAIIRYMRKNYNLLIGERTAEELKICAGTAYPRTLQASMDVRGRNLITGLPKSVSVTSDNMIEALSESVKLITEAVHYVLERTPPELAADVSDRGIVLTGGGSLLYGIDKLLQEKTGINVIMVEDALNCVAIGTGKYIEYLSAHSYNIKVGR